MTVIIGPGQPGKNAKVKQKSKKMKERKLQKIACDPVFGRQRQEPEKEMKYGFIPHGTGTDADENGASE